MVFNDYTQIVGDLWHEAFYAVPGSFRDPELADIQRQIKVRDDLSFLVNQLDQPRAFFNSPNPVYLGINYDVMGYVRRIHQRKQSLNINRRRRRDGRRSRTSL